MDLFVDYTQSFFPSASSHNLNESTVSSPGSSHRAIAHTCKIAYFWDLENCRWSLQERSGVDVVTALRQQYGAHRREVQFTVVCDVNKVCALKGVRMRIKT